jgi:hypothetical protein
MILPGLARTTEGPGALRESATPVGSPFGTAYLRGASARRTSRMATPIMTAAQANRPPR